MQTFTTFTIKGNIRVTEYTIDQFIHGWLFEPTSRASFTAEGAGSLNLLS